MAERSHVRLPTIAGWAPPGPPSIERARGALGGRARSDDRAGWGVTLDDPRHGPSDGVVLCASGRELDVWIGDGLIARTQEGLRLGAPAPRLAAIAAEIRRYWALREGDRVTIDGAGGALREQCRYGALVERDDTPGKIVAVGFRRLRPA